MTGIDIVIVIACVVLAAVMFTVWLAVQVVMAIVRGIASIARPKPAPTPAHALPAGWATCRHAGCRATNPEHARFCRRCGKLVAAAGNVVPMRYVA